MGLFTLFTYFVCFFLLFHLTYGNVPGGSTQEQLDAFCASDGHQNSNYCLEQSLQGTFILRCRNGKAYSSDCSADLYCTNRVTDRGSFNNCYERTNPDPNGDGRAQCAVGNDFQEPFNVTVYADDGSVYKVGPNEVSTPSPDYAGKGFFNNTFYPIGDGDGPIVGPVDLGSFCETGPAPNVNENSNGISTTETHTPVPSSNSNSQLVSSNVSTNTVSIYSSSPTVLFPTGTSTGDRGVLPTGNVYHTPSASKFTPFTGDANSERKRSRFLTFLGGITIMVVYV